MHDMPLLRDLVILVAVAIPVVIAAHRLRIPSVVGFLLTGIVIGPHGLGLIGETEAVSQLAEVGAVLLLFTVGLELSLSRVLKLGREVVLGGGGQVLGTMAATAAVAALLHASPGRAVFAGALVAMSSTAIVLKVYNDRTELDTPHGRVAVGILLFQDLCVVPLMLLLPLLAGTGAAPGTLLREIGISLLVVGAIVAGGLVAVPRVLNRIVGLRNREIFTLCIVVFGLGSAYVTSRFGLSLALGAFLAGLVVSESEYGLQALSDVLPFRDVFSGIFFTSVGMLLDLSAVAERPLLVGGVTAAVILLKVLIAALVIRWIGRSMTAAVRGGLGLAQVGEFSFVLAAAGRPLGLLDEGTFQLFLAAAVLSMLAAPLLIASSHPVAERLMRLLGARTHDIAADETTELQALSNHTIVVGYGLNGRNVVRALRGVGITYVVLEENGVVVRRGRAAGERIYFGDGTRADVLEHVGIAHAKALVIAVAAPEVERRAVATARRLNPALHIVVRTRYVLAIDELQRLGATEVVPEEFETSIEVFARVLASYGVSGERIREEILAVRRDHYERFRGRERPAGMATGSWPVAAQRRGRQAGGPPPPPPL